MIIIGDVRTALSEVEDESIQTCITSPPYWGLRDYGTSSWEGGDENCEHIKDESKTKSFGNPNFNENRPSREATKTKGFYYENECGDCGAVRKDSQIGLEQSPDEYVAELVAVFREVRRVLKDDGTLWLNLGDSYSGSGKGRNPDGTVHVSALMAKQGTSAGTIMGAISTRVVPDGLKPKDLIGIPWRVAFALQADGWYLRQDIIWAKPNPMPESVTDRCTKSHEYIFLLSKSRKYFYDNEAIKEPAQNWGTRDRSEMRGGTDDPKLKHHGLEGKESEENPQRNKRDVWTINTQGYSGAHFAVMPEALVEPCILAGSRGGDTVLDPFTGSGTVGLVALRYGREFIGVELNPEYAAIAKHRMNCYQPVMDMNDTAGTK